MRFFLPFFLLFLSLQPAFAQDEGFENWLSDFRTRAYQEGISSETINAALYDIEFLPRVIEYDRNQPEFTMTYDQYMSKVTSPERRKKGRELLAQNRKVLNQISHQYGVPAAQIVALWGIESDFGRITGGFPVIDSLATLAYEGRRAKYFEKELLNALRILDKNHMEPREMIGSWAGAMGQCQFMPTTFYNYAVDFNKNGRIDIWKERPDVFASAANYLSKSGWNPNEHWGREVKLTQEIPAEMFGTKTKKTYAEWAKLGVKDKNGHNLQRTSQVVSLVKPEGGPAFLVGNNYNVILNWNRSTLFALAAGQLADAIAPKPAQPKRAEHVLDTEPQEDIAAEVDGGPVIIDSTNGGAL